MTSQPSLWFLGFLTMLIAIAPAAEETHYLRAGRLLDVLQGRVLDDRLIRIDGDRITAVTAWHGAPTDGRLLDWSRYMVLPGLIDMHTHLAEWVITNNVAEPLLHSPQETALAGAAYAHATLRAGFTTVHDVGCYRAFTDVALRDAINRGWVEGPRMNVVGAYITSPGGGGEVTGLAPDLMIPADMRVGVVIDADDVRRKVDALFQRGVDSIKLIATGAVLAAGTELGQQELSDAEIHAAVDQAARHGSWVVAHAHGTEGIKAAIRGGVRAVEHASLIDDEGIALAKAHGTFLDMNLYTGDYMEEVGVRDGWPDSAMRKERMVTEAQRQAFGKAVKAGVKLTFGTDAGVNPHGDNARQFALMVRYGMTPLQAIQAATVTAAELMGWQNDVGAIAPGHFADLVAVDGDALADIRVLEHVAAVVKGGALVH